MPDDENKPIELLILRSAFARVAVLGMAAILAVHLFSPDGEAPKSAVPGEAPANNKAAPATPSTIKLGERLRKPMGRIAYLYEGFRPDLKNCEDFGKLPVLKSQRTYLDANPGLFESNLSAEPPPYFDDISPQQYAQILPAFKSMGKMAYARYSELTMSLAGFHDRTLNADEKKESDRINEEIARMEQISRTVTKTLNKYPDIGTDVKTYSSLMGFDAPSHPSPPPAKDFH